VKDYAYHDETEKCQSNKNLLMSHYMSL